MASQILSIVVVGHTNAGKTSLLRTLTRDKKFGEVSPRNATTKHVEQTSVTVAGQPVLRLFDTPGFEDSVEFRQYLRQFDEDGRSRKDILTAFLNSPEAKGRFEQQAKVVRILLTDIDAIIYIIDCTEKPLPKYACELEVLAMCARPVLPILNFVQEAGNFADTWASILADRGLHIKVSFDAVAPMLGSERLLYTKLANLLEESDGHLLFIADALEQEAIQRKAASMRAIAELLVDAGSLTIEVPGQESLKIESASARMQALVQAAERTCVNTLLDIYRFDRSDLVDVSLPVLGTRPEDELFNLEALKEASARLGKGAAIGAAVGLGIDAALAGISLGAGALIGGAIGGMIVGSWKKLQGKAKAKFHGYVSLQIDEAALSLLLKRQLELLSLLSNRTHAAQRPEPRGAWDQFATHWNALAGPMKTVRIHPTWSRLGEQFVPDEKRQKATDNILNALNSSV